MSTQPISFPQSASDVGQEIRAEIRAEKRAKSAAPPHGAGMLWFGGWLFTIGFAKLVWWQALLALVVWPYFLGTTIH